MQRIVDQKFLENNPVVSVCLITYNQVNYIDASVSSILEQQTDFNFEVIIADDHSTDGTWEKLLEFQKKNPNKILLIRQDENIGLYRNWKAVIERPRSNLVAYLEGDDYWTDPLKLSKQYQYLNNHPEHVLCFHDFIVVDREGGLLPTQIFKEVSKKDRTKEEMAAGCQIHQNTMMFRKLFNEIPELFGHVKNLDSFFIAFLSNWGTAGYMSDIRPLKYRIHSKGLWSSLDRWVHHLNGIETLEKIILIVPRSHQTPIRHKIFSKSLRVFFLSFPKNLTRKSFRILFMSMRYIPSVISYQLRLCQSSKDFDRSS